MRTLTTMLVVLFLAVSAGDLTGQQAGPRGEGWRQDGPRQGPGPAMERAASLLLEQEGELGLTEEQVKQIEALQSEMRAATEGVRKDQEALRERIASGEADDDEIRKLRREAADRYREALEPFRGRLDDILTEEQHEEFRTLMRETMRQSRPGRGEAGADRGHHRAHHGRGAREGGGPGRGGPPPGRGS